MSNHPRRGPDPRGQSMSHSPGANLRQIQLGAGVKSGPPCKSQVKWQVLYLNLGVCVLPDSSEVGRRGRRGSASTPPPFFFRQENRRTGVQEVMAPGTGAGGSDGNGSAVETELGTGFKEIFERKKDQTLGQTGLVGLTEETRGRDGLLLGWKMQEQLVWVTQGSALRSARPGCLLAAPLLEGGTCAAENANCGPQAPKHHGHAHTLWSDKVTPATGIWPDACEANPPPLVPPPERLQTALWSFQCS